MRIEKTKRQRYQDGAIFIEVLICTLLASYLFALVHKSISSQTKQFGIWKRAISTAERKIHLESVLRRTFQQGIQSGELNSSFERHAVLEDGESSALATCRLLEHSHAALCTIDYRIGHEHLREEQIIK